MKYPLQICYQEQENTFQLTVPDLPGCKVQEESLDKVMSKVNDAIASHLNILAEYGETIPHATSLDVHVANCVVDKPIWAVIDFDIVPYLGKSHKINVTLPELLIKQIDDRVSKSEQHKTRSGFIASACIKQLAQG
jgi:predicted RNase H-like HicB family nuclease